VLYVGGLHAAEALDTTIGAFFCRRDAQGVERWWLEVTGKGNKVRLVPMAAERLRARGPEWEAQAAVLASASAHWLRHTAGSHMTDQQVDPALCSRRLWPCLDRGHQRVPAQRGGCAASGDAGAASDRVGQQDVRRARVPKPGHWPGRTAPKQFDVSVKAPRGQSTSQTDKGIEARLILADAPVVRVLAADLAKARND
jgi:hypothetical protein